MTDPTTKTIYTAISFAPVQGFIEKSRKLRDLYGASQILSYLSYNIIQKAQKEPHCLEIIQPYLTSSQQISSVKRGVPNVLLFKGNHELTYDQAKLLLRDTWQEILVTCRAWIEKNIKIEDIEGLDKYHWGQEWTRWRDYTWEVFTGKGSDPPSAMKVMEASKLKRDWIAINWVGESSSLTGTDAIAWPRLGDIRIKPGTKSTLDKIEKKQQDRFYDLLARRSERCKFDQKPEGKFIAVNERLSIPELVKRLVTLDKEPDIIALNMPKLGEGFREIRRKPEQLIPGQWTGWFMGDGDQMGEYLKKVSIHSGDEGIKHVSQQLIAWGEKFYNHDIDGLGRIVYAGGDDFLGVIYSPDPFKPIAAISAFQWLYTFSEKWWQTNGLTPIQDFPKLGKCRSPSVSIGFVWAAHSVPQRDVLQHCREAEKRSKSLGRDRVTIRVVFNSGQYVQWTCPWDYLHVLKNYRDRDGYTWGNKYLNWTHIYNDWEHLKARHAIALNDKENVNEYIALELFQLYFGDRSPRTDELKPVSRDYFSEGDNCKHITGEKYSAKAIIEWIDGLVKVGWQLCSDT